MFDTFELIKKHRFNLVDTMTFYLSGIMKLD